METTSLTKESYTTEESATNFQYREVLKNSTVIQKLLNIKNGAAHRLPSEGNSSFEKLINPMKKFFVLSIGLTFINLVVLIFLSYKVTTGFASDVDSDKNDSQLETLELLTMDVSAKIENLSAFMLYKMNNLGASRSMGADFSIGKKLKEQLESIEEKIDPTKTISGAASVQDLNASKRKVFFMQMRLNRFFRANKSYPKTLKELKIALGGEVPMEDITNSTRIHFDKNYLGGWFYNMNNGKIAPNIR